MLSGRKYTLEEVVRILRRRWWLIVLSLMVGTAAGVLAYRLLPAEYESETLITVIPQRRPDSHGQSTVATSVEDRLRPIREQMQNRSRLEKVIQDYGLYKDRIAAGMMEDAVQRMRSDIDVQLARDGSSFRLTYISRDPTTAQKVTERLAALFIEENLPNRENLADDTSRLLESQLKDAKGRLIEQEKKVAEYRRHYAGQLPLQLQGNLQGIQNAQSQLQALVESMNRAREGRLVIERQIAEGQPPSASPGGGVNLSESPAAAPAGQQLEAARAQLEVLKLRHTPDHPDVLAQQQAIRDLQARVNEEGPPAGPEDSPSRSEAARQKRLSDLQAELKVADLQLAADRAEEVRLKKSLASYFGGIEAASRRGSELVELTRDYSTLQESYSSLLQKREDSKLAASLERRQIGEQFRILNPASLPERPHNQEYRLAALFWGPAGGLAIGLLLVGLLEYRDSSFKCEDDVLRVLSFPVLGLIPVMEGEEEGPARHRRAAGDLSILLLLIGSAAERVFSKLQA